MLTEDAYENTTFYVTLPPKTCFCLRSTRHVIENEVIRRQLSSNRGQVCSLNCLNIGQMVLVLIGFVCEKIQRNKQRHNIVSMFSLLNYRYCVKSKCFRVTKVKTRTVAKFFVIVAAFLGQNVFVSFMVKAVRRQRLIHQSSSNKQYV